MESTHFQLCVYIKSAHIHIVSTKPNYYRSCDDDILGVTLQKADDPTTIQ